MFFDVSDIESSGIDTIAIYNASALLPGLASIERILVDGDLIYCYSGTAELLIFQVDTTMQIENSGDSFLDEEFRIFPSPVIQGAKVVLNERLNEPKLFDLTGKQIQISDRTIDASALPPGIYFLSATVNGKKVIKKFVVLN